MCAYRLRDELRAKQKEAEAQSQEMTTLRSTLASKERALKAAAATAESLTDRVIKAEGMLQVSA